MLAIYIFRKLMVCLLHLVSMKARIMLTSSLAEQ